MPTLANVMCTFFRRRMRQIATCGVDGDDFNPINRKTSTQAGFSIFFSAYPVIADQRMPGAFQGEGETSKSTSFGNTFRAVLPRVTNHGGVGELRKGARNTDF
jgi:hypothetical protein